MTYLRQLLTTIPPTQPAIQGWVGQLCCHAGRADILYKDDSACSKGHLILLYDSHTTLCQNLCMTAACNKRRQCVLAVSPIALNVQFVLVDP